MLEVPKLPQSLEGLFPLSFSLSEDHSLRPETVNTFCTHAMHSRPEPGWTQLESKPSPTVDRFINHDGRWSTCSYLVWFRLVSQGPADIYHGLVPGNNAVKFVPKGRITRTPWPKYCVQPVSNYDGNQDGLMGKQREKCQIKPSEHRVPFLTPNVWAVSCPFGHFALNDRGRLNHLEPTPNGLLFSFPHAQLAFKTPILQF